MNIRLLEQFPAAWNAITASPTTGAQDLVKADERYAFDSGLRTLHKG